MAKKNAIIVEVPDSQSERLKQLESQLAEQQALIGRLTIQMDHKQRMLDLYEEEMPEFKKSRFHTALRHPLSENAGVMTKQSVYQAVGTTRQAHFSYWSRRAQWASRIRLPEGPNDDAPRAGTRDRFRQEITWWGHALDIKRSYVRVTRSGRYRFPDLIISALNRTWQSATTYYRVGERYYYLTFIIHVYTRVIAGGHASKTLAATANVAVLRKASANCGQDDLSGLILHSDGGTQYRSNQFVEELHQRGVPNSMCDPALDNAYAERINVIIKRAHLDYWCIKTFKQLRNRLRRACRNYNEQRHHGQLPLPMSPREFAEKWRLGIDRCRDAPLTKDDQAPDVSLDTLGELNLTMPGKYASEGHGQILPAETFFLPVSKEKLLCKAAPHQS